MRENNTFISISELRTIAEFYNSVKLSDVLSKVNGLTDEEIDQLSRDSFLPKDAIHNMAKTVAANGAGVGFRPVNEAVQTAIKNHNAVGKGFDIKAKSADQGPLEGLVPVNQAFSKLGSADYKNMTNLDKKIYLDTLNMFQHYNDNVLADRENYGTYTPKNEQGQEYYGFLNKDGVAIKGPGGKIAFATKQADGSFVNQNGILKFKADVTPVVLTAMGYATKDDKGNRIVKPVTADADQLTQGIIDRSENKIITDSSIISNIGVSNEQSAAFTNSLIDDTKERGIVRHLDESGNPFPEDFANGKPHLFLIPKAIKNEKGIIEKIKTEGKIYKSETDILDNIYNNPEYSEFGFKANPMWGWERNQEGKLQIDLNRVNAQSLSLKLSQYKEKGELEKYKDAESITKTMRELGTLKLSPLKTENRSELISKAEAKLQSQREDFSTKYNKEDFLATNKKIDITKDLTAKEIKILAKLKANNANQENIDRSLSAKIESNYKVVFKHKSPTITADSSKLISENKGDLRSFKVGENKQRTDIHYESILQRDPILQKKVKSLTDDKKIDLSIQGVKMPLQERPSGKSINIAK